MSTRPRGSTDTHPARRIATNARPAKSGVPTWALAPIVMLALAVSVLANFPVAAQRTADGPFNSKSVLRVELARRPPKLISSEELVKFLSESIRASAHYDSEQPIEVAFRVWLIDADGKVENDYASNSFEITPSRPVNGSRLRKGLEDCLPKHYDGKPASWQVKDLGYEEANSTPVNLGLWSPELGAWARKQDPDADYHIAFALFVKDSDLSELIKTSPAVVSLKYPVEHG